MASTTSKPPSKPVQALIVYNRYCWCADEVCVIVLSLRYYYMHFLQSCQDGVLLFSVLKVVQGGRTRTMVIAHSLEQSPLPECCVLARTYLYIGTFNRWGG